MTDYDTEHAVADDRVEVRAFTEQTFKDLAGEETTKRSVREKVSVRAEPAVAEAIAHELLAYVAEESDAPNPFEEGKPVHQRYAEAEPDP